MDKPETLNLSYYEFILTDNCNFRCTYCFDNYFSDREALSRSKKMSIDMLDDLFIFIEKTRNKKEEIHFSWFGGEPLMNFDFIEKFVSRAKDEFKFDYRMSINTNASLLDSNKIDFIIDNKISPAISIDGDEESHDKNRVFHDKKGTWEATVQHLPELSIKARRNNHIVNTLMVVNEKNYHNLAKSYRFLDRMGFIVQMLFDYEVPFEGEYADSIIDQLETLFIRDRVTLPTFFSRKVLNQDYQKNSKGYCFNPDSSVSISPDGKLFFCHQLVPKMTTDENVENYYGDIYKGYSEKKYYKKIKNRIEFDSFEKISEKCNACSAKHWCKGGCFAAHWYNTKDMFGLNENMCKMHQAFQQLIEKF